MQKYPLWVPVSGPGHPQNPGYVLVENEDQEREAQASGKGPADLNPPPDAGQKSIETMTRDELKQVLLSEGIPDEMTDDDIREAIKSGRERRAQNARDDAEHAQVEFEKRKAGGDHGDGDQTLDAPEKPAKPNKDAAGDAIPPDPADEANKVPGVDPTRDAPTATSAPGNDTRPDEAKEKVADDEPAGNVTDAAATPPDKKRGTGKA